MLPKNLRLTRKEFDHYFPFTRTFTGEHFLMRHYSAETPPTKFAVVIPKKAIKSAVKRHIIKRRIFGVIKDILKSETTESLKGVYIFILKKKPLESKTLTTEVIQKEIHELISKITTPSK